ncbi:MAG: RnfABCDGE type electron transport complex subunit G [Flavobacteriaceae bacterium]|nr:RnfABCDGE type electron transport complex subunit G [Flavobacteriaceae bacterium]
MVGSLLVITIISGLLLGAINNLTLEPKAKAKMAQKINALKQVLPDFDNNPVDEVKEVSSVSSKDSIEIFPALKNGAAVGAAVIGSSDKGFSGLIRIMVGFNTDGTINNIAVLEQKETPGLGTKMKDEKFLQQFRTKNPSEFKLKVTKDGGEVDALTGETITTRAFCEATQRALG